MKKIITFLMAFGFMLISGVGWGQTTVSYDFSAGGAVTGLNEASPGIALDANIGFGSFRNSGTANPAIVSAQLRLYQNATKGGSIKIYASNGVTITQVIVHASGTTGPAAFTVDGGAPTDLADGTTYTMSSLSATSEVEFYQKDGSSANRIYVDSFEVTYTAGGGPSSPSITNIIQTPATDITSTTTVAVQADVVQGDAPISWVQLYWGTSQGDWVNEIEMTNTDGNTYLVDSEIPAQPNGTTVYYVVQSQDDDFETTTSAEFSYTVLDPATTALPYEEDFSSGVFGDIYIYTVTGTNPWVIAAGGAQANGFGGEAIEEHWMVLPGIDFDAYSVEVMTFTTYARFGAVDEDNYLKLFYSADYPGIGDPTTFTWTELAFDQPAGINNTTEVSAPSGEIDLSGIAGESVYLAFKYYSTDTPTSWRVEDISIYENKFVTFYFKGPDWMNNVPHDPEIWGPFNGWSSAATMTFDAGLNWWNVTVDVGDATAEIEYQSRFSQDNSTKYQKATGNFGANATFTTTTGEIWVDASNNSSFTWSGNDFYLPADKITETQPPLSEPENHVTGFTATANSGSSITVSWTDSDAANYLVKGSTVGYEDIVDPVDGTAEANALLVQNVGSTIQQHSFTGLDPNTPYYFKIFPYNGTGALANYKTDGVVPEATATTLSGPLYYHTGFETSNSTHLSGETGYAIGVYELNGLQWEIGPEALIGSLAGDIKQGERSVRLRLNSSVYGSITMIEDKAGGIGSISFLYSRSNFSGDRTGVAPSFVVEYMVDGAKTWVQAGAETSLEGINELTRFTALVNVDGNVRVRIRQTAGDNGKRWNVDEIVITNYNSISYLADMSLAAGFDPETDVVYMAGTIFGSWQEPGSNPAAMMERLGLSSSYLKAIPTSGGDKNGPYEYKYFVNAGWAGGEWADATNRMISPASGSIVDDLFGYVTFSGSGPVSVLANWDASAIPSFRNVLVRGDADVDQPLTVEGLLIANNASMAVEPLQTLTVNGTLTNNAGTGGLGILSDATGTGSLIHNTADVPATVQRYINGGGYHNVGVPLTGGATAGIFLNSYLRNFNAVTQAWEITTDNPDAAITVDQGYMIWYTGANTTYNFAGNLNNGSFTALTNSGASGAGLNEERYNLVPNPYASAIDWLAADGWTKTNVRDAIYIWNREETDIDNPNGQYASFVDGVGNLGGSRYIPVGQSFFVEATTAGAPALVMNNDVRVHSAQAFFKQDEIIPNVLRIRANTANGKDETVVRLHELATTAFDGQYDARKLSGSPTLPQLFSTTSDNHRLSINALPLEETTIVPLALEWQNSGEVTFNFSNIESFDAETAIYLEDLMTGQMVNLRENAVYNFTHTAGNDANRFKLHFYEVLSIGELAGSNVHIWSHNDNIYLSLPDHSGQTVRIELFDLLGNKLMETTMKLENPSILRSTATGIVIVRITAGNEVFTNKLFIR